MNVTIVGAGNMGRGIGHRLVAGGHDVTVVDRDPEEAGRPRSCAPRCRATRRPKRPDLVRSCAAR
jgi:Trk K+ transport system NAD-binding subunit